MEIVCLIDLTLKRSKGGFEKILVITDQFSRYAQAIPTRNETAKTTARVLFDKYIVHYGFPVHIHNDQGANFESNLIKELFKIAGVEKSQTKAYHPMGNGQMKRFNQTLLQMLGTLQESQQNDWKAHGPTLVHAYNATFHDSTVFSPYFLMFAHNPRLAINAFLGLNSDSLNSTSHTKYIKKLRDCLSFAYQKAWEVSKKADCKHKLNYVLRTRSSVPRIGDRVLVQNAGIRGRCKLADQWEKNPCIVIDQPNDDIPFYRVKREGAGSKTRVLHRNFLLPFIGLPTYEEDEQVEPVVSPETVEEVNELDEIRSINANLDLSSDPDLEAAYDGGISDNSHCSSPEKVRRYEIPMWWKPRESGVLPRTVKSISVLDTQLVTCPSSSEEKPAQLQLGGNLTGCNVMIGFWAIWPHTEPL